MMHTSSPPPPGRNGDGEEDLDKAEPVKIPVKLEKGRFRLMQWNCMGKLSRFEEFWVCLRPDSDSGYICAVIAFQDVPVEIRDFNELRKRDGPYKLAFSDDQLSDNGMIYRVAFLIASPISGFSKLR